jgi:hypothetical protein
VAAASFALVLAALTVPYELLVRTSEARYGMKRATLVPPRSRKIDVLAGQLAAGERYSIYAIGTSRTEEGIRSDVIAGAAGKPTFNLGMGGSSLLAGFEVLELLGEKPSLIIAGVTPMDFTDTGMKQGAASIRMAHDAIANLGRQKTEERGPAVVARSLTYTLLHGAAPLRRRTLGQWAELGEMHGDVLKFLNNADAVATHEEIWIHGFLGVPRVATPERFRELRPASTPGEYREEHEPPYTRLQEAVTRLRSRGAAVVFVRLPLAPTPRQIEDAAGFDRDIQTAAARCGVPYIDGNALMGEAFTHDRRNFVDGGHLNVTGATAFSRALAPMINARLFQHRR